MTEMSQNLEDFVVMWLDATLEKKSFADYVVQEELDLRRIINYSKKFIDPDKCLKYMVNPQIKNEKIFLIVSGSLGQDFVPLVHSTIPAIHSIYVYCSYTEKHEKWSKNFDKIKGVYADMKLICKQLRKDTIQCSNDLLTISIGLTKEEASMNYIHLLKELDCMSREQTMTNLINECQAQYVDNDHELQIVDEFAKNYRSDQAILWYKRTDTFLYRVLNKALRIQNMPVLLGKLGFFIKDLHQQELLQTQEKYRSLIVYRGFSLPDEDFEKLQQNGFVCAKNILSANSTLSVARNFAIQSLNILGTVAILFEIETLVADEEQQEVVFPMGTVFFIRMIKTLDCNTIQCVRMLPLSM